MQTRLNSIFINLLIPLDQEDEKVERKNCFKGQLRPQLCLQWSPRTNVAFRHAAHKGSVYLTLPSTFP